MFYCMYFSLGLSSGIHLLWLVKEIEYFNTCTILYVENNNPSEDVEKRLSQNHDINFMVEKVNLIHQCYLKTNYIGERIVSHVLEGDIVKFKPLYGSDFGISI